MRMQPAELPTHATRRIWDTASRTCLTPLTLRWLAQLLAWDELHMSSVIITYGLTYNTITWCVFTQCSERMYTLRCSALNACILHAAALWTHVYLTLQCSERMYTSRCSALNARILHSAVLWTQEYFTLLCSERRFKPRMFNDAVSSNKIHINVKKIWIEIMVK